MLDRETNPIDEYVRSLRTRLHGPVRLLDDLLAEARDGLWDAAADHRDAGLEPRLAQRRAVAEFGPVRPIAAAYQTEIAARSARTLAMRTLGCALVLLAGGDLVWRGSPWAGTPPPSGYQLVSMGVSGLWLSTAVLALACAGALAWTARRPAAGGGWLARVTGYGLAAALTATLLCGLLLWAWSLRLWPAALAWPPMLVGMLVLTAGYGWLASGVRNCLRAAR
ncbi:hypothetical protein [Plantactinospora sp. KBS50]|uniref:hypothetical protein n=1 Tax=Plantactinospora sp. KBS50 TaxID=2024580 RepID=UPI0012FD6F4E|nr:hypothetical protein [Plantactinospora sp. KBS50]